jgi:tetratricopeptide (TPR) repeat protein
MKWFISSTIKKIRDRFSKSTTNEGLVNLEKGKQLYLSNQIKDAIFYLDSAINSGFDTDAYEVRGNCLQRLDYHYNAIDDFDKAIEINPLKFSSYYSRAKSKKAILDFTGQIEDLHNAIYYYKKGSNAEKTILKAFETDLLLAKTKIDNLRNDLNELHKVPAAEIKTLIRESLNLIKKTKVKTSTLY